MERLGAGAVVFAARPRMMGGSTAGPFSGGGGTGLRLLIGGRGPVNDTRGAWTVIIGPCRACFSPQGRAGHTLHGAAVVLFLIDNMSCPVYGGVEKEKIVVTTAGLSMLVRMISVMRDPSASTQRCGRASFCASALESPGFQQQKHRDRPTFPLWALVICCLGAWAEARRQARARG